MTLRTPLRLAAVTLAAGALASCGGKSEPVPTATPRPTTTTPAPSAAVTLSGGSTTLRLSATSARVLDLAGVKLTATGAAQRDGDEFAFPIEGGKLELSPLGGRIEHAGGLRISAHGQSLDATDLVLDPARAVLTAKVAGQRVPLLSLDMQPPDGLKAPIVIPAQASVVGGAVVSLLGERLGVGVPKAGLPLGHVVVSAKA